MCNITFSCETVFYKTRFTNTYTHILSLTLTNSKGNTCTLCLNTSTDELTMETMHFNSLRRYVYCCELSSVTGACYGKMAAAWYHQIDC